MVQRRTWEAPVSCRFRGLSLGRDRRASSAREHQQDDEAGGTIATFKFSVSAKSAATLRKLRKVLIRLSGLHDLLPWCALKFFKTSVSQASVQGIRARAP